MPREDGLTHPADTSRSNLAAALSLLSRWRLSKPSPPRGEADGDAGVGATEQRRPDVRQHHVREGALPTLRAVAWCGVAPRQRRPVRTRGLCRAGVRPVHLQAKSRIRSYPQRAKAGAGGQQVRPPALTFGVAVCYSGVGGGGSWSLDRVVSSSGLVLPSVRPPSSINRREDPERL
jgi:hypothetical protein